MRGEARRKHWQRQDEWEIEKEKLVIVAGISIFGDREEELKMFLTGWWRRQGSLLVWHLTVGESEITIGDTRIAHGGTKHQSTKWSQGKTEQGNKPFDNPCELLKIEIHLYLVWFAKNVSTIFWESIDRHFAMKEESSQFSAYWIGLLCGWEGLVCQHGA